MANQLVEGFGVDGCKLLGANRFEEASYSCFIYGIVHTTPTEKPLLGLRTHEGRTKHLRLNKEREKAL